MPTRSGWTVVKGTTWAEHEAASEKFWAQLDPMEGMNLAWDISRDMAVINGFDVDRFELRGSPVTLHRARRPLPRRRRGLNAGGAHVSEKAATPRRKKRRPKVAARRKR